MSTPPTPTSTSLSADELREIAELAVEFDDQLIWRTTDRVIVELRDQARAYAEGVIAERLRGRERCELARTLANALNELADACAGLVDQQATPDDSWRPAWRLTLSALDDAHAAGLLDTPTSTARKARLLEGGEK